MPAAAHFPGQAPIDAYGNGGFRFAGMSHRGSLLILPSGIYGWASASFADIDVAAFDRCFAELPRGAFVLLGTGKTQHFPMPALRQPFAAAGLGLEAMSTGAAARTYNVLLAEGRTFGAALIAVD